jgi:hypothetical protein
MSLLARYARLAAFAVLLMFALPAIALPTFDSETAARGHCPTDTVVWLNTKSGVFHYKGQRWYGRTKQGSFVCKAEAEKDHDRASRNGQ